MNFWCQTGSRAAKKKHTDTCMHINVYMHMYEYELLVPNSFSRRKKNVQIRININIYMHMYKT